jgi:hypothetical protein
VRQLNFSDGLSSLFLDVYGEALTVNESDNWRHYVRDVDQYAERPILDAIRLVTVAVEREAQRERNT